MSTEKRAVDDPNRETPEEKRLARRPWLANLVMLTFLLVFVGAVVILAPLLENAGRDGASDSSDATVAFLAIAALFVLGIGGLVVMSRLLGWSMEGQRRRYDRGGEILRRTLPQTVSEADEQAAHVYLSFGRPKPNRTALAVCGSVLVLALVAGLVSALVRPWLPPGLEWLLALVLSALVGASVFLIIWLVARRRARQMGARFPRFKSSLLQAAGALVLLTLLALVVVPIIGLIRWLFPLVESNAPLQIAAMLAVLTLGLVLVGLLMLAQLLVPLLWALAPLKRGDYETAVRRARLMEQVHMSRGVFQNLAGMALFLAGRYEEARAELEESIRSTRREIAAGGGAGLDNIGCVLAAQGRYDEAIEMFEASLAISPKIACPNNDLAHALLEQGHSPERALELTDRGLALFQASLWQRLLERYVLGHLWANRAWALAQLGRDSEAAQALERALAAADRSFVPEFSGVLYCAGRTELVRGDRVRAAEHLTQACQLDPVGHYGRLAARALAGVGPG
jgi:tetratricopeptide (TPR) repeat protein